MLKKILIPLALILLLLTACGTEQGQASETSTDVDIDLTLLSATMVYSQVYDLMINAPDYYGKTIKLEGEFISEYYDATGLTYTFVVITDATGCCPQGLEFKADDDVEMPEHGTPVALTGVIESYKEGDSEYLRIAADEVTFGEA